VDPEKGIVEKNVQDRRRGVMREATERRWSSLAELNEWLQSACRDAWEQLSHPEWPELSIADVWQDEARGQYEAGQADGSSVYIKKLTGSARFTFSRGWAKLAKHTPALVGPLSRTSGLAADRAS
jgi:hypothetical protein